MTRNSYRYNTLLSIGTISMLLMLIVVAPARVNAANDDKDEKKEQKQEKKSDDETTFTTEEQPIIAPLVSRFVGTDTSEAAVATSTPTENTATTTPADSQNTEPTASTTPPTTPTEQRENQSVKDTPRNDPSYNQTVENILNQIIAPADTEADTKKTEPKKPTPPAKKATTTSNTSQATSSSATTTEPTNATSTPIASVDSTINGNSNQFAPSNYYIPFDKLSPEMTYTLSGLAMILGIAGAVLILREPREAEELLWSPQFSERSLQES